MNPIRGVLLTALLALSGGCADSHGERVKRIDASLAKSGQFLIGRQSPDGAWRGDNYGCFRDGPELTGFVMSALYFIPQAGLEARKSYRKGTDYLAGMVGPDGRIVQGPRMLNFPVYTAACSSRAVVLLDRTERNLRAQRAWLAYLCDRQLNESLGWSPRDPQYGGWGFSIQPPRRSSNPVREDFFDSNLSATVFGLAALRSAKVPADNVRYRQVLTFVKRCQNFPDIPADADGRFDDGGFFFMPGDAIQNKGGQAGADRQGRARFHSYGTMTADGVRALVRCGLPPDHTRVAAARAWLERNFSARHNPGTFEPGREVLRDATYYYWAWSVAHALGGLNIRRIHTLAGEVDWARELTDELIRRQRPDGSWVNRYTDAKEDDPLVATPWAAAALAICRQVITQQPASIDGDCKIPAPPN